MTVPITRDTVDHVARLARLHFAAGEREVLARQLDVIVGHVSRLQELDTSGVEPQSHVLAGTSAGWRADEPGPGLPAAAALANAPAREGQSFGVPAVIAGPAVDDQGGAPGGEVGGVGRA